MDIKQEFLVIIKPRIKLVLLSLLTLFMSYISLMSPIFTMFPPTFYNLAWFIIFVSLTFLPLLCTFAKKNNLIVTLLVVIGSAWVFITLCCMPRYFPGHKIIFSALIILLYSYAARYVRSKRDLSVGYAIEPKKEILGIIKPHIKFILVTVLLSVFTLFISGILILSSDYLPVLRHFRWLLVFFALGPLILLPFLCTIPRKNSILSILLGEIGTWLLFITLLLAFYVFGIFLPGGLCFIWIPILIAFLLILFIYIYRCFQPENWDLYSIIGAWTTISGIVLTVVGFGLLGMWCNYNSFFKPPDYKDYYLLLSLLALGMGGISISGGLALCWPILRKKPTSLKTLIKIILIVIFLFGGMLFFLNWSVRVMT